MFKLGFVLVLTLLLSACSSGSHYSSATVSGHYGSTPITVIIIQVIIDITDMVLTVMHTVTLERIEARTKGTIESIIEEKAIVIASITRLREK